MHGAVKVPHLSQMITNTVLGSTLDSTGFAVRATLSNGLFQPTYFLEVPVILLLNLGIALFRHVLWLLYW